MIGSVVVEETATRPQIAACAHAWPTSRWSKRTRLKSQRRRSRRGLPCWSGCSLSSGSHLSQQSSYHWKMFTLGACLAPCAGDLVTFQFDHHHVIWGASAWCHDSTYHQQGHRQDSRAAAIAGWIHLVRSMTEVGALLSPPEFLMPTPTYYYIGCGLLLLLALDYYFGCGLLLLLALAVSVARHVGGGGGRIQPILSGTYVCVRRPVCFYWWAFEPACGGRVGGA